MRLIFMGTPDFSVPVLESLYHAGHEILAVVTQPDKPKGRGKAILMTPVKEKALELGLTVYQPARVREPEFVEILKGLKPELMVVVAFGQILPQRVLDIPRYGCINIHASLLPEYRGSAPIQWVILNGEKETGVTTMMMDAGVDTGDMLERTVIPIGADETGGSLHDKLSEAGAKLILSTIEKLQNGTLVRTPQPETDINHTRMLDKALGNIDWTQDAEVIERLIRGLNPWPSAYTHWNGKTLKLWKAQVLSEEFEGVPGQVVVSEKDRLFVKTGKGVLSVLELQPEGKKRMAVEAFLRGYPVETGTVFGRER